MFFLVFSSKVEDYKFVEEVVLSFALKCSKAIVVKEYGKSGAHPHLNLVCTDTVRHDRNLYRKVYKLLGDEVCLRNPRLLCIKTVVDFKKLVEGYLSKESKAEVLYKKGFNYRSPRDAIARKTLRLEISSLIAEIAGRPDPRGFKNL